MPGQIKTKVPYDKSLFNNKANAYVRGSKSESWVVQTPGLGGFGSDSFARDRLIDKVVPEDVNGTKCLVFTEKSDSEEGGRQLAQKITEEVESMTEAQDEQGQGQGQGQAKPMKSDPKATPGSQEPDQNEPAQKPSPKKKKPSEAANQDEQSDDLGQGVLFESKGLKKAASDLKLRRIAFLISGK